MRSSALFLRPLFFIRNEKGVLVTSRSGSQLGLILLALTLSLGCQQARWAESHLNAAPSTLEPSGVPIDVDKPVVLYETCTSHTLRVAVRSQEEEETLKGIVEKYPDLEVISSETANERVVWVSLEKACSDNDCADDLGWSRLQHEISRAQINEISCEPLPEDSVTDQGYAKDELLGEPDQH